MKKLTARYTREWLIAAVLVFTLVSGSLVTAQDSSQELTIAVTALPTSLDPIKDNGLGALTTYALLYDRLMDIDVTGQTIPSLATSWEPTSDTTWRIELRTDVTFHNGEPFNAEAAKYVIERAQTAEGTKMASAIEVVTAVRTLDEFTLEIETSQPWSLLPNRLSRIWMYPPNYFEEVGLDGFLAAPVGSGPYKFVEWEQDNFIVLERNEEYWREVPQITEITLRHMPDQSARVNSVEAGEVDVAFTIDPEQVERLERAGFQSVNQPAGQAYIYFFRTGVGGPLADARVRQAINHAVDVEAIVDALFLGKTSVLQGQPVGADADGFVDSIQPYGYDPERAQELLAEAGYADGFTLDFDGTSGIAPKDKEVAELIAAQLAEVGIKVNITLNERGVYLDKLVNANMAPLWSISLNYAPTMDLFGPLFNSTCAALHKSHCDPDFDVLFDEWVATFDPDARNELGAQLLQYYHDEALALFLWQVPGLYVVSPDVSGFAMQPDFTMNLSQTTVQ